VLLISTSIGPNRRSIDETWPSIWDRSARSQVNGRPSRARSGDVLQSGLESLGVDVADRDPRALSGQGFRDGASKASSGTKNESRLVTQTQVHQGFLRYDLGGSRLIIEA
jgi:hypothetical protein